MKFILFAVLNLCILFVKAQMLTGYWKGFVVKQNGLIKTRYKLEVKLVVKNDSIVGTSYYYASPYNYYRYRVKGWRNNIDNTVIWYDDSLLVYKNDRATISKPLEGYLNFETNFNCPGSGVMKLDGSAKNDNFHYDVALQKSSKTDFNDEWNFVIEHYTEGANDKNIIEDAENYFVNNAKKNIEHGENTSIKAPIEVIETKKIKLPEKERNKENTSGKKMIDKPAVKPFENSVKENNTDDQTLENPFFVQQKNNQVTEQNITSTEKNKEIAQIKNPVIEKITINRAEPDIEQKLIQRKKEVAQIIKFDADSIEFFFYDNAEVDGDSISVFLNDKLLAQHIKLTEKGYVIKLFKKDITIGSSLIMVAENLGAIPPNTALVVAYINGKRVEARLKSTEETSAVIKFE